MFAWGYNFNGQLGDNTLTQRNTPVQVVGVGGTGTLTSITAINTSGTSDHVLAVAINGTVLAWGYNSNGQLGNNTTTDSSAPVQVLDVGGSGHISNVTAIAAGALHSAALKSDGTVWSWGDDGFGDLGDGGGGQSLTPVQAVDVGGVGKLTGIVGISAGQFGSTARKSDGTAYGWGSNLFGQLGVNSQISSTTPVQVLAGACSGCGTYLTGVATIASGLDFTIIIRTDGTTYGWGDNANGQLGDSTTTERDAPILSGMAGVLIPQQPPAVSPLTTSNVPGANSAAAPYAANTHQPAAEPVDTATGSFFASHDDLNIPGRSYPLEFSRTYNSVLAATNSPLGYGWQPSYGMHLTVVGSVVTIAQETGATVDFTLSGGVYTAAPRVIATLTLSGGVYTFKRNARDTFITALTYTGGNLTSVTDPAARSLTIGWMGSHITSVTDANVTPNRVVSYQYNDGQGNLTDVIDPKGGRWHFTYDTGHQLLTMQDPKCYAVSCPGIQNTYTNGQVTAQKDQLNRQTTFAYSVPLANALTASNATTTVTDPKGNVTLDGYEFGLLTSMTRGYGTAQAATTQHRYDPNTLAPTLVRDANGNATTYTVDSNGNVLTATDPLGRKTINTYNAFNELLTSEDPNQVASLPNGATTTNVYDTQGNLTSTSRPLTSPSATQTVTYNHTDATHPGDVTSMVDPDSKTWTYGYDTNGYRNSVTDPLLDKSTMVFNNDGMMTSLISPKGNVSGCGCASTYTTSYINDVFGKPTTVTPPSPAGPTISTYDADENLSTVTDPNSNTTTYVYDFANQQTQVKRADTPQTTLTTDFNQDGTVLDHKDGKTNAILTYGYDSLARVTTVTDALSNITTLTYDLAGNRLTLQDPGGNCATKTRCTTSTYDADNELKTITYSDGVTPNVTNTTYDSDGQRTGITDGTGSSTWVWDSLHRLTSYTNGKSSQVQYAYNLRNLPTKITYPGTTGAVNQAYDDAGRLISVQDWLTHTTTFGYDVNSNMTLETLPAATGVVDTNTFDNANNLATISDKKGSTTIFAATYGRDSANQITSDTSVPAAVGKYKYTTLNQLCYAGSANSTACASPPASSYPYTFDSADNLTKTENATHTGSVTQQFNAADELCWTVAGASANACASAPTGATTYGYDTRGNRTGALTGTGGTCDAFDQANRLTSITKGTGATCTTPTTVGTYGYNGDGLRMSKTIGANTTQNTWGMGLLLQEKVGSATATSYVYGPGGLPLEQITPTGTLYYYHHDQLGSTRAIMNSAGASKATYTYDPYGNVTACTGARVTVAGSNICTGTITVTNPLTYSGQYRDNESGLMYLRARYYSPGDGQFMSRDPAVAKTRSPYAYVVGNPLNATDPTGLYLDYTMDYNLGGAKGVDAKIAMALIQQHPEQYFPFPIHSAGGNGTMTQGASFNLNPVAGPAWKVTVSDRTLTSFTFSVTGFHGDMPGSTITFSTYTDSSQNLHLSIHGIAAPWSDLLAFVPGPQSPQDMYMGVAMNLWPTMAQRLINKICEIG